MMVSPEIWHLDTKVIGKSVWCFDRLNSTSTLAAQLAADPGNNGLAILAEEQTQGRGQHGRVWESSPGVSVLLSVLIFPPAIYRLPSLLTAWAAAGVGETIQQILGIRAAIKWPNDILIDRRKVCGILIEQGRGTVAGIGLNVRQTPLDFSKQGLAMAASLQNFTPHPLNTHEVARALLRNLDDLYQQLLEGQLDQLLALWKNGLGLLGKAVVLEERGRTRRGILEFMDFERITLRDIQGQLQSFPPENISQLFADSLAAESEP
ncbi:MAG: biotin--[acetyl-CoA-carboxylase] ligase [Gemmataceae bacterium]|nr:biotin--[acetyl-CoA-carboxylase] ligase [Gemmataceae bacterium]